MKKLFIALLLVFVSCSKTLIPENTLAKILYEMYLTEAIIASQGELQSSVIDSTRVYEPIIEKYGYSLTDLRKTMIAYAAKKDKLPSVYEKVRAMLADEKRIYQPLARIEKLSKNIYIGSDSIMVKSRSFNKRPFNLITLTEQGIYDVSASFFFFKNDSTKNPKMTVWLESRLHKDSIVGKQEADLIKDSLFNHYSLKVAFNNPDFNQLKGFWLDFEEKVDSTKLTKPDSNKKQTLITKP
ncbi:MAG: DUF4296 domain-containing protein, partial [Prevotellaceae bacterium]|nr:DUF4296 domain-containing protein [Prevotellaceae bacterium]